jgi:hypothetical protein
VDRFAYVFWKERQRQPFPLPERCDFCGEKEAMFECPSKTRGKWCTECDPEVLDDLKIEREEVSYV